MEASSVFQAIYSSFACYLLRQRRKLARPLVGAEHTLDAVQAAQMCDLGRGLLRACRFARDGGHRQNGPGAAKHCDYPFGAHRERPIARNAQFLMVTFDQTGSVEGKDLAHFPSLRER